ncbi:MAG: PAS domain-containing sensor histidine kinase, partial [Dehalococcoidales bacterium]|nr:PAS domain-containing sensor histidine kinase [Dehalococcoidales bacterium]
IKTGAGGTTGTVAGLQSPPDGYTLFLAGNSNGTINPALEKITGFSSEILIGRKAPYPWFLQADSNPNLIGNNLSKMKALKEEKQFKKKTGRRFWVQVTTIPVQNKGKPDFYLQTWIDITEAKKSKENMDYFITQISRIQEEERKRISNKLHEGILQSLAAVVLKLDRILGPNKENYNKIQELSNIKSEINGIINEIRKFSHELRPGVLDYLGLPASLEILAEELCSEGINTSFNITGEEKPISPEQAIALYRIAQEAISNIRKYSQADKASILLEYLRTGIRLTISDNGKGFKLPARTGDFGALGKLGIISMSERARLNRGNFSIRSKPDKGTTVQVHLPQNLLPGARGKD